MPSSRITQYLSLEEERGLSKYQRGHAHART